MSGAATTVGASKLQAFMNHPAGLCSPLIELPPPFFHSFSLLMTNYVTIRAFCVLFLSLSCDSSRC